MEKNTRIAFVILAIVAVAGGWYFFARDDASETLSVWSDDGRLELVIPQDAYPEGVAASDISVSPVSAEEFFDSETDEGKYAYRLEPEGTEFLRPVTVTFHLPPPTEGDDLFRLPFIVHVDEDGVDTADNISYLPDENGQIVLSGEISHFSIVATETDKALFDVQLRPASGSEFGMGQSFTYEIVFTPKKHNSKYELRASGFQGRKLIDTYDTTFTVAIGTRYVVAPHGGRFSLVTHPTKGVLSPTETEVRRKDAGANQPLVIAQSYTCEKEGEDAILHRGNLILAYTQQIDSVSTVRLEPLKTRREKRYIFAPYAKDFTPYKCVNPPAPEASAPSFNPKVQICGGITGIPCPSEQ